MGQTMKFALIRLLAVAALIFVILPAHVSADGFGGMLGKRPSMGSGLSGFTGPSPTVNYIFTRGSLPGNLTYAGADNGTFFDSSGVLQASGSDAPRFDHDKDGNPLGILIEEARTNSALQSEDFGTTWAPTRASVTTDDQAAPDGNGTADKVILVSNDSHYVEQTVTVTAAPWTFSVFARAAELDWIHIILQAGANAGAFFDLTNGVVGTVQGGVNTAGIDDIGGGWYRVWIERTPTSGGQVARIFLAEADNDAIITFAADTGIHLWGAQVELGSTPTSYIPTTTGTVTRTADSLTATDVSWFRAAVGTFFWEGSFPYVDTVSRAILTLDDGDITDRFLFTRASSETITFSTTHSSDTDGASDGLAVISVNTTVSVTGAFADDDVNSIVDGASSGQDTSAALPLADSMTTLRIGKDSDGNECNCHIERFTYWPRRMIDNFGISITN
ncbi:hypothetical protein LCGC14_1552850 [marine sediment metagenome]|uniref:Uncharacterized protein n=1 Tax=marine sediment metagenome TaxID=412755 RepID=A0A0F9JAT8_9ZZZZ